MRRLGQTALLLAVAVVAGACAMGAGTSDDEGTDDQGPGGGGPAPDPDGSGFECEEVVSLKVEVITYPPDLLFVLDRSSSMGEPTTPAGFDRKWDTLIDALGDVVETYRGNIYPGLMLVPSFGETCGPGHIDIAPSRDSDKNFVQYLEDVFPGGGSPLHTSLANARANFASRPANPNGRYVLVAADGLPNCDQYASAESIDAVEDLRADGIETYVLGIAADEDATGVLDDMAAAGGTGSHYPIESASDLLNVLENITSSVSQVACEYVLEEGPAYPEDLEVKIGYSEVPHSPDHTDGWDYDPETRTLSFYGEACERLRTAGDAEIVANYCGVVE